MTTMIQKQYATVGPVPEGVTGVAEDVAVTIAQECIALGVLPRDFHYRGTFEAGQKALAEGRDLTDAIYRYVCRVRPEC